MIDFALSLEINCIGAAMPKLLVMPHDVFTMLQQSGVEFSCLDDVNYMSENLAASDMADIHIAMETFPFEFSPELEIHRAKSPLATLTQACTESPNNEKLQDLLYRVKGRITTISLRNANEEGCVLSYELYPVNETLWVAVQQRLRKESGDPSRLLLRANNALFDGMIAQALHTHPFERVCATNLFTYYLGSL